jgi:hypothetical protein
MHDFTESPPPTTNVKKDGHLIPVCGSLGLHNNNVFWGLQSLYTLHSLNGIFLKMKFRCALNEFVNTDFVKINQALV